MTTPTDILIAAEREAHYDGDKWRSHCEAQERVPSGSRYAADILQFPDRATCSHLDRITYGETGSVCLRCHERWGPSQ